MLLNLYVCDAQRSAPQRIAQYRGGWSELPVLWCILLADAHACEPLPEGDGANAGALGVRLQEAQHRLTYFTDCLLQHPITHRIPEIVVYLEAVRAYLERARRAYSLFRRSDLMLVAQAAEADDDSGHCDSNATEHWQSLQSILQGREWQRLDEALGFTAGRHSFEKWYAWCAHFGFDTLSHPYFSRLEYPSYASHYLPPPEPVTFDKFDERTHTREAAYPDHFSTNRTDAEIIDADADGCDANPDEAQDSENSSALLEPNDGASYRRWHDNYYLVYVGNKVGMVHAPDPATIDVILPADWDHIQSVWDCWDYLWAQRDGKWGVIHVAHPCKILIEPCCDALHPAYIRDPMVVEQNGRFGVIDAIEGRWLLPAEYEEIAWHRSEVTSALRMRTGDLWGLLNSAGDIAHPCRFESLDNQQGFARAEEKGWRATLNGRVGWLGNEGEWQLACEWDDVKAFEALGLYAVLRDDAWGLVAHTGAQWLPCDYLEVTPLSLSYLAPPIPDPYYDSFGTNTWPEEPVAIHIASCDPARSNVLIAVRDAKGMGVVDQANRILIPLEFDNVEPIVCGSYPDPRWVRVIRDGKQGLWSLVDDRQVFSCVHTSLEVLTWPGMQRPMLITFDELHSSDGKPQFVCRLWFTDGKPAVEGEYCWIDTGRYQHDPERQHEGIGRYELAEMAQALVAGEWLRALPLAERVTQEVVHVRPGRPPVSELTAWQFGYRNQQDLGAALKLALRYYEGLHVEQDFGAARTWAQRACGLELAKERAPDPSSEAAYLLAKMLYEGLGGPRDAVAARRWAERAVEICDHPTSPPSNAGLLLAKLLLDPAAGEVDAQRAVELLSDIDAPSLDEGEACYHQALCYRDGVGVERDLDVAHTLLVRADACGVPRATTDLIALLRTQASAARGRTATTLSREADYYESKAAAGVRTRQ